MNCGNPPNNHDSAIFIKSGFETWMVSCKLRNLSNWFPWLPTHSAMREWTWRCYFLQLVLNTFCLLDKLTHIWSKTTCLYFSTTLINQKILLSPVLKQSGIMGCSFIMLFYFGPLWTPFPIHMYDVMNDYVISISK